MAAITPSALDFLYKTGNMAFEKALQETPVIYPEVSMELPVSGPVVVNSFLDRLPTMSEWVGPRTINSIVARGRAVSMTSYQNAYSINRNTYEDDEALSVGLYSQAVRRLAESAKKHPDLIRRNFLAANAEIGYDGVALFSTSHPTNGGGSGGPSGTQSNLLVSTGLTYDNLGVARETMRAWVGADNTPLGIEPDTLEVAPQLETEARQILNGDLIPSSAGTATQSNIWKGALKLVVNPWLVAKPNNWYLYDTSKGIKPFAFYNRQAPRFSQQTSPNDAAVFYKNEFEFGVDSRFGFSETVWWLSLAATSSGSY